MKLLDVNVRNYRSCQNSSLSLQAGLTALIGVNGSGKSNLLNALLLLNRALRRRYPFPRELNKPNLNQTRIRAKFSRGSHTVSLRAHIYYETDNRNFDDIVSTKFEWNLSEIAGVNEWIEIPIEMFSMSKQYTLLMSKTGRLTYRDLRNRNWLDRREMAKMLPEKMSPAVAEVAEFLGSISYFSANQFADPTRCPVAIELEDGKPRPKHLRGPADHDQFVFDLYRAYKGRASGYERYSSVVGPDGIGLIDELSFSEVDLPRSVVEVRTGGRMQKGERTQLLVIPTVKIGGVTLSLNQLSEGTYRVLALLFYVLTDESRLLLLEEPEVCVHHGLLNNIVELIKHESARKQIVISTHSDFVLDHLAPEEVVLVKRMPERGTTARSVSKAMSRSDFRALKAYLSTAGNLGEYWREGGLESD